MRFSCDHLDAASRAGPADHHPTDPAGDMGRTPSFGPDPWAVPGSMPVPRRHKWGMAKS